MENFYVFYTSTTRKEKGKTSSEPIMTEMKTKTTYINTNVCLDSLQEFKQIVQDSRRVLTLAEIETILLQCGTSHVINVPLQTWLAEFENEFSSKYPVASFNRSMTGALKAAYVISHNSENEMETKIETKVEQSLIVADKDEREYARQLLTQMSREPKAIGYQEGGMIFNAKTGSYSKRRAIFNETELKRANSLGLQVNEAKTHVYNPKLMQQYLILNRELFKQELDITTVDELVDFIASFKPASKNITCLIHAMFLDKSELASNMSCLDQVEVPTEVLGHLL